jgi:3-dehydroquinate synthase
MQLILIPTTLLAMVDAAYGGKTAINYQGIKNLLGTFYPSHCMICDIQFLSTLPEKQIRSGMAEVIKYALIHPSPLLKLLTETEESLPWKEIIAHSLETKRHFITNDLHDLSGKRATLNWGHTIGHAIEALVLTQWGEDAITHGQAIALGMLMETQLTIALGYTNPSLYETVKALIEHYKLMTTLPEKWMSIAKEILPLAASSDKKRFSSCNTLPVITLAEVGHPIEIQMIPLKVAQEILELA